ncbi:MAG: DUF805 domain-containing protein [Bauldia sp.]
MRPAGMRQFVTFFFRPRGRIGRTEYFLGAAFIHAVNLAIVSFALNHPEIESIGIALLWSIALPSLAGVLVVMAKRCHDIGLPGSFVLLAIVPGVGILWEIALVFIPGSAGPNRYGTVPLLGPD